MELLATNKKKIGQFDIVNASDIYPISDIYDPKRLNKAIDMIQYSDNNIANGIVAQIEGLYFDLAGRHRNFAATKFAIDSGAKRHIAIPVMVVDSLESSVDTYQFLQRKYSHPLNEIGEPIEQRWSELKKRAKMMSRDGYFSLANVVKKHHMGLKTQSATYKPALF